MILLRTQDGLHLDLLLPAAAAQLASRFSEQLCNSTRGSGLVTRDSRLKIQLWLATVVFTQHLGRGAIQVISKSHQC